MNIKITKKFQGKNVILSGLTKRGTIGLESITINDSRIYSGKFMKSLHGFIKRGVLEKLDSKYQDVVADAIDKGFPVMKNIKSPQVVIPLKLRKIAGNVSSLKRGGEIHIRPEHVDRFKRYFSKLIGKGRVSISNDSIDFTVEDIVKVQKSQMVEERIPEVESTTDIPVETTVDVPVETAVDAPVETAEVEADVISEIDNTEDDTSTEDAESESVDNESDTIDLDKAFGVISETKSTKKTKKRRNRRKKAEPDVAEEETILDTE